jgi:hypothetical protein
VGASSSSRSQLWLLYVGDSRAVTTVNTNTGVCVSVGDRGSRRCTERISARSALRAMWEKRLLALATACVALVHASDYTICKCRRPRARRRA